MKSWIELDEERLRHNFGVFQSVVRGAAGQDAAVLAVVKANAYGHGLEHSARALAGTGAEWLGVTGVEEGQRVRRVLREGGVGKPSQPRILVMCGISEEDAAAVAAEELTPVVWSLEQVSWLSAAVAAGKLLRVCVEIDSGMTRQGVRPGSELRELITAIRNTKGLQLDGVMTHFASAEVADSSQTASQKSAFEGALEDIRAIGITPAWISVGNTSGVDLEDDTEPMAVWAARLAQGIGARPLVRAGLAMYGYALPVEGLAAHSRLAERLQQVMTWKAKVIGLEDIAVGAAVGYNGKFVAVHPMRLALIAVGYADGLRRDLSSTNQTPGGWMMVRGQRAPIVGRISMNLTTVDVTGIDGIRLGDEAIVLGEGISAKDHAQLAGTIAYEILCGVRAEEKV
ncbi:alanine racemase [soil metagenome]